MIRRTQILVVATAGALVAAGLAAAAPAQAVASSTLFAPYVATDPGSWPANVATGDVTGDGRPDVVMTTQAYGGDPGDDSLWVYAQRSDGTLAPPAQVRTPAGTTSTMSLALADLDGDHDLDVAVTSASGVLVYRQDAGGLTAGTTIDVPGGRDLDAADLDRDGLADLVVNTSDGVAVVRQTPTGPAPYVVGRLGPIKALEVEVGDVTGDGRPDVVTGDYRAVNVYAQQADGGFAAPASYPSGGPDPTWDSVNAIAVGDVDGDGRADVHVSLGGNRPNAWVVTRHQLPDGTLGPAEVRTSYDMPEALTVGDVTGDGRGDLVVTHGGWNRVGVYDYTPGTAPTEALYAVPYASHYAVKGIAVGDVSGDGRADVVLADYNNGLVLLRGSAPGADLTPPQTTITSGPTGTVRSRTVQLAFTADEPSTFQCQLDNAPFAVCMSPTTYSGLAGGPHKAAVRAVDKAGNVDASPASAFFTVDGPDTTITSGPSGTVRDTSATFAFTADGASGYQCALDSSTFTACASPTTYAGLGSGSSHTFSVRAVGPDGLVDATPATRTYTVAAQADLALTTTATPLQPKKGAALTWTSQVRDAGPGPATGVSFSQTLPAGAAFVSASLGSATAPCGLNAGVVRCTLPDLAAGATATVTVRATVTVPNGTLTSTAQVSTTAWDPTTANDSATTTVKVGNGK